MGQGSRPTSVDARAERPGCRQPTSSSPHLLSPKSGAVVTCPSCATLNRVPPAATGNPRCAACHRDLPWLVETHDDDDDFAAVIRTRSSTDPRPSGPATGSVPCCPHSSTRSSISRTMAVEPLERTALWDAGEPPETYPTGL